MASLFDCSNRTFMELKYGSTAKTKAQRASSNRTFMELKFQNLDPKLQPLKVLIAPLWN